MFKIIYNLRFWGYPVETHWVKTPDNYILALHRIPGRGNKSATKFRRNASRFTQEETEDCGVVFLQHGLLDSSATWVINLPDQSLGFVLADAGCDVWMGNIRGNMYSTNHTTLSPKEAAFWEFSFDEFAGLDLPAMLGYVLGETGAAKLAYIGHSQGTLMGFIAFSQNKDLAARISLYTALAPVARITYIRGLIKALKIVEPGVVGLYKILGWNEFEPSDLFKTELAALICPWAERLICNNFCFLIAGYDLSNLNTTRVPVYGAHVPAGTSVRNMVHWTQLLTDQKLQKYDYGSVKKNMIHYNSSSPPEYDISTLGVPTALFSGGNDFLADPRDVAWLEGQLHPSVVVSNTFYDEYNHLDFVWGLDASKRFYGHILDLVIKFNS